MRNKLKLILAVLVFAVICSCIGLLSVHQSHRRDLIEQRIAANRHPGYIADIKGLIYEANHEGRSVFRISADRLVVRKKKIGHFSIGIFSEMRLENAVFRMNETLERKFDTDESFPTLPKFDEIFNKFHLPFNSSGKISSVELTPVQFELCDHGTVVAKISASCAMVRFKQKDILFKKKVILSAGNKTLYTEQLSFCPKENQVTAERQFLLKTPDGERSGRRLTTDVYLRTVHLIDPVAFSENTGER